MRTTSLCLLVFIGIAGPAATADMFSDAQAAETPPSKMSTPCEKIEQQCTKAGYTRQSPKSDDGKDLDDDCFGPVINGQHISGVTASDILIQQCLGSMPKKGVNSRVIPRK